MFFDLRLLVIAWVFSIFSCLNGQVGAGATKLLNFIAQFASKWNLTFLFQKVKGNVSSEQIYNLVKLEWHISNQSHIGENKV
jgi:hypothetical protein